MTKEQRKTLLLVDGSSCLYRAFHAMPSLTNSGGMATGAAYGMTNMLKRLVADYPDALVVVVFDARGKTFRDDMYPEYKANRPPMPQELRDQIEIIHRLVRALGFPLLQVSGVEADDVIGTLARQAHARAMEVLISTGDKDMAQLVTDGIRLIGNDGTLLDARGVVAKFGVQPGLMVDYLSLVGDTVDNVPGVPKVGPKTAVKWLERYGSLEEIMARADEIGGKVGEHLRASLDHLPLSKALVTIKCDVALDTAPDQLLNNPPDRQTLQQLYGELEFKTWLSELLAGEEEPVQAREQTGYEIVQSPEAWSGWLHKLQQAPAFALAVYTVDGGWVTADIAGISLAVEEGEAAYVCLDQGLEETPESLHRDRVLRDLQPLLEDPAKIKLGHDLKCAMSVLAGYGVEIKGAMFDAMLGSYVLDSTATGHGRNALALKYLRHKTMTFEDVAGKGAKQLRFDQIPLQQAGAYGAQGAETALRLYGALWPKLQAEPVLQELFESMEMPLTAVLSRMERYGVKVDAGMLKAQSAELAKRMDELQHAAFAEAGESFNLGSPKQIQHLLFGKLALPVLAKTPKGQPSTAEAVLQELAGEYALPRLILEHRSLSKLKSTYTDTLPGSINKTTGRVHTSYHQAVAATGRLSSSDPNLQNIPVRTAEGRRIRQAFTAPPGYRLVAADYSQIELRIMAHLSADPGLLKAFAKDADIHRATAAEVFQCAEEEVSPVQRRQAKAINFGLIYGMSAFGLGRQLGIPRNEAQAYIDTYFARYPGVKAFMDTTRVAARERGYVETVFGRRLYLQEIRSRNVQRRQYAERTAINAPMQGSAADIIKRAMLRLDQALVDANIRARLIMQVHDELLFEVAEEDVSPACREIEHHLCAAATLAVPLTVEVGTGANWDEAH